MAVGGHELWAVAAGRGAAAGAAVAGLLGDAAGAAAASDWLEEHGGAGMIPFVEGEEYLIQTVTLYYVGRVRRVIGAFVELEDASWVHWTGRLSTLARLRKFKGFPAGHRTPRTEYLGVVGVSAQAVTAYLPGPWDLPKESVQ